jgi:uncharacterized RDD family membrane protein YckC
MGGPAPYAVPDAVLGQPVAPVYKLSGWGKRVWATIIDSFVITAIFYALVMLSGLTGPVAQVLAVLVVITAYSAGMLTFNNGQTFGKRTANIRVVREDGKPIEFGWAAYRETFCKGILGLFPFYLLVDYLWPLPDDQNRAIHDIIVKSRVVEV